MVLFNGFDSFFVCFSLSSLVAFCHLGCIHVFINFGVFKLNFIAFSAFTFAKVQKSDITVYQPIHRISSQHMDYSKTFFNSNPTVETYPDPPVYSSLFI